MFQPFPPLEVELIAPPPPPPPKSPPVVSSPLPPPRIQPVSQPPVKQTLPPPIPQTVVPLPVEQHIADPVKQAPEIPPPSPVAAVEPVKTTPPLTEVTEAAPPSFDASYLNNPKPDYPRAAKKLGLQGTVLLRVAVNPAGQPEQITVLTSSGIDSLDEAAVNTVRRWTFVPARQGDRSIAGSVNVPIRFVLH